MVVPPVNAEYLHDDCEQRTHLIDSALCLEDADDEIMLRS